MVTTTKRSAVTPENDLVVLVHGTYAGRESDEGDSWWQRGSRAWRELSDRLPKGTTLPEQGRIFHWSGENSERSRIKAARDLLSFLTKMETRGRRFHLIGHSHGGSVIWHALRLATLQGKVLAGLRTWSTVGTPFLHHRTRGAWHVANVFNLLLAIILLRPAVQTFCKLGQLVGAGLFGMEHGMKLPTDGGPGWLATTRGMGVTLARFVGVPMTETAEGLRIGTYDPASGQTIVEHIFFTPEGWLILAIVLLAAYVYLNLAVYCLSPVLESLCIRKEKRLERDVMKSYQGRWLGLWSPDDEAINGLRTTLNLSMSFVSPMVPRESVLLSDRLSLISRPYYWFLTPLYNRFFRPMLDGIIRSHITKTAQGNNRPSAEVIAISSIPIQHDELEPLPAIPEWLNSKIVEQANHHARDIAPKLRRLLGEPSFVTGLETFGHAISGQELVHTSYFDHVEILDILATHIAWGCGNREHTIHIAKQQTAVFAWLRGFKSRVGEELIPPQSGETERRTSSHEPIMPRRRHSAA